MLKLVEKRRPTTVPRSNQTAVGQKVSRLYRKVNHIRHSEFQKLKAIVPSVATKTNVSKVRDTICRDRS